GGGGARGLLLGADLIACLMFLMGGRITAAATSGAIQRQGERLRNPAQAGLEWYGLMALVGMAGGQLAGLPAVAGAGAAVAALVVFWRLARWKVWKIVSRPEVFCLHLGFVWLGLGLLARAATGLIDAPLYFVAIHGVTVGALGTFSIAIMTRTSQQRARISVRLPKAIVGALFLITLAAGARLAVDLRAVPPEFILVSAGAWSAAFAVFLGQFGAIVRMGRPHPPGQHS
ncbi:MAG: NnrS family protein, partial [Rhodospirillales bacterium]|nr:NnrS family protein [Rhodospirillales bacterium]